MWSRWDAGWYVDIARSGYQYEPGKPSNAAFFPLYPAAIRIIHAIFLLPSSDYWWLATGILLSNTCLLAGLLYFRALLVMDVTPALAARAILYLLIFPTTLFLSSVYTESLFFATTLAAFYYARKEKWLFAGICTALATLTRSQGIILLAPLFFEYLSQREFKLRKLDWNLATFALPPIALFAFAWFFRFKFGSWSVFVDVQPPWGRHLMWPWHPLSWVLRRGPALSPEHHDWLDFGFLLLLMFSVLAGVRRLRGSYTVYGATAAIFFSAWGVLGSMPRFVLVVFPVFITLASFGDRDRDFHLGYLLVASMLAAMFMIINSQWNWVA